MGASRLVGHFLPDQPDILAINMSYYHAEEDSITPYALGIRLVSLADSSLGEEIQSIQLEHNHRLETGIVKVPPKAGGALNRPADFNGDGLHDLVICDISPKKWTHS